MKILILAAACAASLALSGCAGLGQFLTTTQSDKSVGARILNDIQGCSRVYGGSLGPTGIQGSFNINCDPVLKDGTHTEPAKAKAGLVVGDTVGSAPVQ